CPVYERVGGHAYGSVYPGPIGAVLSPQLTGQAAGANRTLPYASTLCGACYDACPVRINIPEILVHLRQEGPKPVSERAAMGVASWLMRSPRRYRSTLRALRWAAAPLRLVSRRGPAPAGRVRRLPWPVSRWTASRDAPVPPAGSFRQWWGQR